MEVVSRKKKYAHRTSHGASCHALPKTLMHLESFTSLRIGASRQCFEQNWNDVSIAIMYSETHVLMLYTQKKKDKMDKLGMVDPIILLTQHFKLETC